MNKNLNNFSVREFNKIIQDLLKVLKSLQEKDEEQEKIGNQVYDKNYFPNATKVRVYQNESKHLAYWLPHPNDDITNCGYNLIKIQEETNENLYESIVNPILKSLGKKTKIREVFKVENDYLKRNYELKKLTNKRSFKNCEEVTLYHVTLPKNVDSICMNNFNWRCTKRHKFGTGVSFTSVPRIGHLIRGGFSLRVMFVCKVLKCETHNGDEDTVLPKEGFDTTHSTKKNTFIKYEDSEYYPQYAVYYKFRGKM